MTPILKVFYRSYRLISRLQHWERRRFTRAGMVVMGGLIATAMTGLDTENTVGYQAFMVLLSLLLLAVVFSWFFRARFSATRLLPRFGTVGYPLNYRVLVTNLTRRPQRGLTLLEDLADPRPSFEDWRAALMTAQKQFRPFRLSLQRPVYVFKPAALKEATLPAAPPQQEVEVGVELTPLRRGLLRFAGITLARPDPFALFRGFAKVPVAQTALILPRRYPLPPIALPGALKYQEGGVALASNVGQSEEFVALRDYRPGDPLRHIHWRSWAKVGKPVVKEFEDEFFVRHALVLDTFTEDLNAEVFEEAVSVAASFACTIPSQESLLDLLFVGAQSYCFTAGRGLAHADQMLEVLASVRRRDDKEFGTLEHLVLNHVEVVSGCICVLVAWDATRRKFIEKLRALGVPLLVLLVVPAGQELALPEHAGDLHVLEVGRIEEGLAKLK